MTRPTARFAILVTLFVAGTFGLGGCPEPPPDGYAPPGTPASTVAAGVFNSEISLSSYNIYQIEVPAGEQLEVIAMPQTDAWLGIGFVQSPDNLIFRPYPPAQDDSNQGSFRVRRRLSSTHTGGGFRFLGTADAAGVWRLSIVAESLSGADPVPITLDITINGQQPSNGGGNTDPNNTTDPNTPITDPPTAITLERVVQTGDSVPGQSGATFTYFSNPLIDADGRVAFYAGYTGGNGEAGLYVYDNGALSRVFDTDPDATGEVPGHATTDTFRGFTVRWDAGSPTMSWGPDGKLIFVAHLNGASQPNTLLRWRASDGNLLMLADTSLLQGEFSNASSDFLPEFFQPALGDTGVVRFVGRYSYFDTDRQFILFNTGMFSTNGNQIRTIVAKEIGADGEVPDQDVAARFEDVELLSTTNAGGETLFQASYTGGSGNRGVYLADSTGSIVRVVDNASGRSFPGLTSGTIVGSSSSSYQSIALGDRGEIAIDTVITQGGNTSDTVLYWNGSTWTRLLGLNSQFADALLSGINRRGQLLFRAGALPYITDGVDSSSISAALPSDLSSVPVEWPAFGAAINNQNRALIRASRATDDSPILLYWNGTRALLVADTLAGDLAGQFDTLFATGPVQTLDRTGTLKDRPEADRPGRSGAINDADEFVFRIGSLGDDGDANTSDDTQAIYIGRGTR